MNFVGTTLLDHSDAAAKIPRELRQSSRYHLREDGRALAAAENEDMKRIRRTGLPVGRVPKFDDPGTDRIAGPNRAVAIDGAETRGRAEGGGDPGGPPGKQPIGATEDRVLLVDHGLAALMLSGQDRGRRGIATESHHDRRVEAAQ